MVMDPPPANTEDTDSIPGSGRSTGEENGNPFQYSYLENPMDRGAWWATVHHDKSDTTKQLTLSLSEETIKYYPCPGFHKTKDYYDESQLHLLQFK